MGIRHVPMCHKRAPARSGLADDKIATQTLTIAASRESDSGLFSN